MGEYINKRISEWELKQEVGKLFRELEVVVHTLPSQSYVGHSIYTFAGSSFTFSIIDRGGRMTPVLEPLFLAIDFASAVEEFLDRIDEIINDLEERIRKIKEEREKIEKLLEKLKLVSSVLRSVK
ncbi:hypothetical protein DRP04_10355 [Archaeoglobales archaeon]|nr:MAG: hypothetical protein DRP04_10355 [Archaeoglobales archaeon]